MAPKEASHQAPLTKLASVGSTEMINYRIGKNLVRRWITTQDISVMHNVNIVENKENYCTAKISKPDDRLLRYSGNPRDHFAKGLFRGGAGKLSSESPWALRNTLSCPPIRQFSIVTFKSACYSLTVRNDKSKQRIVILIRQLSIS